MAKPSVQVVPADSSVIHLKTDYRDYYDHWFGGSQQPENVFFNRQMTQGMDRQSMMRYMRDELGLATPRFGTVKSVSEQILSYCRALVGMGLNGDSLEDTARVVVHLDQRAHAGEGKVLMSVRDALEKYTGEFAVEYIQPTKTGFGVTMRYLQVGRRQFWLKYSSDDDWRSNAGEVNVEFIFEAKGDVLNVFQPIRHPLFAIDFVIGHKSFAIDFNESPCLKGTGIEDIMSGLEVFDEISGVLCGSVRTQSKSDYR